MLIYNPSFPIRILQKTSPYDKKDIIIIVYIE